jgi:hypothetical protein
MYSGISKCMEIETGNVVGVHVVWSIGTQDQEIENPGRQAESCAHGTTELQTMV